MNKKYIKNLLPIILILSLGWVHFASAQSIGFLGHIGLNAILSSLDGLAYLIGYIGGQFVTIGGTLVNWALDLNSQVLSTHTVKIGWTVSRDLANLGFVLAIILISFATILRIETYQMQKLLWKLITAALLVNFSLVAAGVLLDFSGILTNFFINKATTNNQSAIGANLANAFQVQTILQQTESESKIKDLIQGLTSDPNKHFPFTASVVFVAIFTTIVAISLISLAAMLYIRYIWLTMLLILMPIAWLCWIWPDLEGNWKNWWGKFMQWTFFAPAVTFFIYLALSIVTKENQSSIPPVGDQLNAAIGITFKDFSGLLGRMLSVLGILYGGMYTANAMGIAGANAGFAVAKGVKNAMVGGAVFGGGLAGGALAAGAGTAYKGLNKAILGRDKTFSEDARSIFSAAAGSKIPFVGRLAQAGNRALSAGGAERMGQYQKEFDGLDSEARINALNAPIVHEEKRAGLIASIAKNNQLKKAEGSIGKEKLDSFVGSAINRGGETAKILLTKNPNYAKFKVTRSDFAKDAEGQAAYNAKVKEEVSNAYKFMSVEAMDNLDIEELRNNPEYVAQLRGNHLTRLLERSAEDVDKFIDILNSHLENIDKIPKEFSGKISAMAAKINANPAWAGVKEINPELLKNNGRTRTKTPPGPQSSTEPVPGLNLNPPPKKNWTDRIL